MDQTIWVLQKIKFAIGNYREVDYIHSLSILLLNAPEIVTPSCFKEKVIKSLDSKTPKRYERVRCQEGLAVKSTTVHVVNQRLNSVSNLANTVEDETADNVFWKAVL